jgi:hypothetical protein
MKPFIFRPSNERGSTLVAVMVLGVILLIVAGSYLGLIGSQKDLVIRSETWNASLTMAEAGVEEAMAQINNSPGDLSANGWGGSGSVFGPVVRTLAGGSYRVVISNATTPVIYSTGTMLTPVRGDSISRLVRVETYKQSFANIALGARRSITMNGNDLAVDSYNSRTNTLSTNGQYDPNKTSTNGNIASMGGVINIGNRDVKGSVYLGTGATFTSGNNGGITGTTFTNANIDFPYVVLTNAAWQNAPLSGGTHSFTNGGYYIIDDQYPIDVKPGITVTLNVTTGVTYSPTSVQVHGPPSMNLKGNEASDASVRPENLNYYGLPSLTSITYSGNAAFVGVVYAPSASVTMNGGGSTDVDFIGSLVADTITMNGHYKLHYDESLSRSGAAVYVVQSWQEL